MLWAEPSLKSDITRQKVVTNTQTQKHTQYLLLNLHLFRQTREKTGFCLCLRLLISMFLLMTASQCLYRQQKGKETSSRKGNCMDSDNTVKHSKSETVSYTWLTTSKQWCRHSFLIALPVAKSKGWRNRRDRLMCLFRVWWQTLEKIC